jgi:predicted transcriptional regulator of viral defense system
MTKKEKEKEILLAQIKELIKRNGGLVKTSQLYELSLDYRKIQKLVEEGSIQRVKNGYYGIGFNEKSEESILAGFFPDGVLCMDSALYYYCYIREKPNCWHIAVDKNTSKSRFQLEYPLIKPYYVEPDVLKMGVKTIPMDDGTIQIYNKERLICDCLKFEDKLDRAVMQDALKAYLQEPKKDIQKLMEYARSRKVVQKVQNRIGVWL